MLRNFFARMKLPVQMRAALGTALASFTILTLVMPVQAQSLYGLLPAKTKACWSSGNCSLDDIIRTGVAFANLLIGLSSAAFFATFIYGGALYLLSFGSDGMVTKAKKAMSGAAIGMLIVMSAWTIVNYLASSITGKQT